jgi:hypothetical protein
MTQVPVVWTPRRSHQLSARSGGIKTCGRVASVTAMGRAKVRDGTASRTLPMRRSDQWGAVQRPLRADEPREPAVRITAAATPSNAITPPVMMLLSTIPRLLPDC